MKAIFSLVILFSSFCLAEVEVGQPVYFSTGEVLNEWYMSPTGEEVQRMYVVGRTGDTVRLADSLDPRRPGVTVEMNVNRLSNATAESVDGELAFFDSHEQNVFRRHKIVGRRNNLYIVQREDGKLYTITQEVIDRRNRGVYIHPRFGHRRLLPLLLISGLTVGATAAIAAPAQPSPTEESADLEMVDIQAEP